MDVGPGDGGIIEVNESAPASFPAVLPFTSGVSVSLEAVPAPGYHFDNWSGALPETANPITIVVDCNKNITANFSRTMHTLTVQVNGSGATTPPTGNHGYRGGTVVSMTAIPDSGWHFDGWTGSVTDPDSVTIVVTIDSDKTVVANFSEVKLVWWLIGGAIVAIIIAGAIIWLAVRSGSS
ncbi:hypothetical protein ACFLYR_05620 [Chloroflexota bacterium]